MTPAALEHQLRKAYERGHADALVMAKELGRLAGAKGQTYRRQKSLFERIFGKPV